LATSLFYKQLLANDAELLRFLLPNEKRQVTTTNAITCPSGSGWESNPDGFTNENTGFAETETSSVAMGVAILTNSIRSDRLKRFADLLKSAGFTTEQLRTVSDALQQSRLQVVDSVATES